MNDLTRIDTVADRALVHFGSAAQIQKAIEELGELIAALARRYSDGAMEAVITEIADVQIMIRQLRLIYGAYGVDREIERKLVRLEGRIEGR